MIIGIIRAIDLTNVPSRTIDGIICEINPLMNQPINPHEKLIIITRSII